MRLLQMSSGGVLSFINYHTNIPPYAILSHTWGKDHDEVKYDDILSGKAQAKAGYHKIEFCAQQARKDSIDHFWIDTCCINKADSAELSEAITSMFRWYQNAKKCYAYLTDVSSRKRRISRQSYQIWENSFRNSKWFTRGWTLQELLAPSIVEFFSRDRELLGSKATLDKLVHEITGVPIEALIGKPLTGFSVEERFVWSRKRETTRPEDKVYSLFGIFGVALPSIYGEGEESALKRLKREIGVTPAQIDKVLCQTYDNKRLTVERLSGEPLPLECCFINLGVVDYVPDNHTRLADHGSDKASANERLNKFSLTARFQMENSSKSAQVSLPTLFEPRKQKDGMKVSPNRLLIWGRAGMGKTTLCKKIVYEFYTNGLWKDLFDRIMWIPLRRIKGAQVANVVELLMKEFFFTGLGERPEEALRNCVQDSRTLFLLDGLDEVSFALGTESLAGSVLLDILSRPHVIVTSRPHNTLMVRSTKFDLQLETVGFLPEQVGEYVQQVAARSTMSNDMVRELCSYIQERPLLQSLARIPVQLDAICYTWGDKALLRSDATMTNLYSAISDSLWRSAVVRLGKKRDGITITQQQIEGSSYQEFVQEEIDFLQELAFRGLYAEVIEFGSIDIKQLESGQQMLSDVHVHLPFLRISDTSIASSNRTLHFIHLTYQEFFAAQYFVRHWISGRAILLDGAYVRDRRPYEPAALVQPEEFLRTEKYVDRYNIFWRFVVGLLHTEHWTHLDRFFQMIEDEPRDLVGRTHQRLIVHCLGEVKTRNSHLHNQLRQLEDHLLEWIFYELRLSGTYNPLTSLTRGIECSDYVWTVLLSKVETEKKALDMLCDQTTVSTAVLNLMFQKLNTAVDEDIQASALHIIAQHCSFNQEKQFLKLVQDMQHSKDTTIKVIKAWQRSRLQDPAIKHLTQLLQDSDPDVRSLAANALGGQDTIPSTTIDALTRLLQDSSSCVQTAAASALRGQCTLPSITFDALTRLLQDQSFHVRQAAAETLRGQCTIPSTTVHALTRLLQDPSSDVRSEAAWAFSGQRSIPRTTIDALTRLLQDSSSDVRRSAAYALRKQDTIPSTTVDTLTRLLQDPSSCVQTAAASALKGQCTVPRTIVDTLIRLLPNLDQDVREDVVRVLKGQSTLSSTTINAITQLLQDPDEKLRTGAVQVLTGYSTLSSTTVDALIWLLQTPHLGVRAQATKPFRWQDTPYPLKYATNSLEIVNLIASHAQIIAHLADFESTTLQHIIQAWLRHDSTTYFIHDHHFYTCNSGNTPPMLWRQDQVEQFKRKWQQARDALKLPRIRPLLSAFNAAEAI